MMQQLSFVLPGCQPWYKEHLVVTHISPDEPQKIHIAYCSTLTIVRFVFIDTPSELKVRYHSLATPFESNISSIAWHPTQISTWVCATNDRTLCVLEWQENQEIAIKQQIKTRMTSPWTEFKPETPRLFAYQDYKDSVKVLDMHNPVEPSSIMTLTHDCDIICIKWLRGSANRLLVGDSVGNVCVFDLNIDWSGQRMFQRSKHSKKKLSIPLSIVKDPEDNNEDYKSSGIYVKDMRTDPSSEDYVLIAFSNSVIVSYDFKSDKIISTFPKTHTKISGLEWISAIPGGFVSTDARTSVMKVWSVSQSSPLEIVKLLNSPVHTINSIIPANIPSKSSLQMSKQCLFISFDDGSVGVLNLISKTWLYLRHGSHTETIFYCDTFKYPNVSTMVNQDTLVLNEIPSFSTQSFDVEISEPLLLGTASYDGTIKIWDMANSTFRGISLPGTKLVQPTPGKCSLNGFNLQKNIGITCNPSIDFTFLDSYPPLAAGRKKEDATTMETKYGIWYSMSWSSDMSMRLVAGSSRGNLIIYDAKQARCLAEYNNIHSGAIMRVAWNPHIDKVVCPTANMVASCGTDSTCVIWKPEDGSIYRRYKLDQECYGCSWSPLKAGFLSAGLMDGKIIVWDTVETKEIPRMTLFGHGSRVFHTCWSPLMPCYLASASDDKDVRIWRIDTQKCISILQGHRKHTRCIVWHTEITNLILTGSWDADIRIWNALSGDCLKVISKHAADIYSLASFPSYPFLHVSVSRDNTIRLWKTNEITKSLKKNVLDCLIKGDFMAAASALTDKISLEESYEDFRLAGPLTRQTQSVIKNNSISILEKISTVLKLFSVSDGDDALRRAILFLQKNYKPKSLYHDGFSSILPPQFIIKYSEMRIQGMESSSLIQKLKSNQISCPPMTSLMDDKPSAAIVSATIRNEMSSLLEAAKQRLELNDIQSYCENLCLLGHWDRALAMAPAVSLEYWRDLMRKYNQLMLKESLDDTKSVMDLQIPYLVAMEDWKTALDALLKINDDNGAYLLASILETGGISHPSIKMTKNKESSIITSSPTVASTMTIHSQQVVSFLSIVVDRIVSKLERFSVETSEGNDEYTAKISAAWNIAIGDLNTASSLLSDANSEDDAEVVEGLKLMKL